MDSFLEEIKRFVKLPKDSELLADIPRYAYHSEQKTREEKFGQVAKSKSKPAKFLARMNLITTTSNHVRLTQKKAAPYPLWLVRTSKCNRL